MKKMFINNNEFFKWIKRNKNRIKNVVITFDDELIIVNYENL